MGSSVRKHVSARRRELRSEGRQRFHTNLVYFTELAPMLTGSSLHLISQWIQTVILAQCLALLKRAGLPWAHSHGPRERTQHTHTHIHIQIKLFFALTCFTDSRTINQEDSFLGNVRSSGTRKLLPCMCDMVGCKSKMIINS